MYGMWKSQKHLLEFLSESILFEVPVTPTKCANILRENASKVWERVSYAKSGHFHALFLQIIGKEILDIVINRPSDGMKV